MGTTQPERGGEGGPLEQLLFKDNQQLHALTVATQEVNVTLETPVILRQLVSSAMALTGASGGCAGMMIDNQMVLQEYNRQGRTFPIDYRFPLGYGVPGWVMQTGDSYVSDDAEHDPHVIPEIRQALGFHNLADVPIFSRAGQLLGCFELHNKVSGSFDQNDIELLKTLAASAAIALENAQLLKDRQQSEKSLRFREEQLLMLVKHAPAAIAMFDMQMRYVAVSDRFLADYRLGNRNVLGMSHYDVFPEIRQMGDWLNIHRRCLAGASESREEDPFLREDGTLDWVKWEIVPWRKLDDSIGGIVMFTEVITERKRWEEQLKALNATLEQRVAERTEELQHRAAKLAQLTSRLALTEHRERERLAQLLHDHLQQLLVGMKYGLELLANQAGPAHGGTLEQVQGLLNESIEASRTLTAELSPPILREAGLVAGLEWLVRWMEQKHGMAIELKADPSAQPDREDVRVLLFESARELLFNVTKHAGVMAARVELASLDRDHLQLTVSDEGAGFSPAEAAQDDGALEIGGFGLMSIRERLNLLGGCLDVATAPGQGTRITIIAPIHQAGPATPRGSIAVTEEAARAAVAEAGVPGDGKIRILLVDDHTVMREGLSQMLQAHQDLAVIGQASDGQEGVEQARQVRPDVILMDSSMPRMDGVEATRVIHAEQPDIRIIGLSMYDEADRAAAMIEAGAVGYLSKSGSSDVLLSAIRKQS